MRGILPAVSAEAVEPLRSVAGESCAAPSEVRPGRPISERREKTLEAVQMNPAGGTAAPPYRGKTSSIENMTDVERQDGSGDHRVLPRGGDIAASNMPAEMSTLFRAFRCSNPIVIGTGSGNCIGPRHSRTISSSTATVEQRPAETSGAVVHPRGPAVPRSVHRSDPIPRCAKARTPAASKYSDTSPACGAV